LAYCISPPITAQRDNEKTLGQPGDPLDILRVVNKVARMSEELLACEVETRGARLSPSMDHIREMTVGWAVGLWQPVRRFRDDLVEAVSHLGESGTRNLMVQFDPPQNADQVEQAIALLAAQG
jgi:hypothetical protein